MSRRAAFLREMLAVRLGRSRLPAHGGGAIRQGVPEVVAGVVR
jgi:hypothetical protein